ncbi:YopT-type cysteine protease domain-containing protein [Chromobacterium sp. CV08]|uniref:YopT-type cysteine protease domain-containing protein n=1 Tax=Chromobacterium sp. CV08 TaxID=3133274 RepID=UPI003DA7DF9C
MRGLSSLLVARAAISAGRGPAAAPSSPLVDRLNGLGNIPAEAPRFRPVVVGGGSLWNRMRMLAANPFEKTLNAHGGADRKLAFDQKQAVLTPCRADLAKLGLRDMKQGVCNGLSYAWAEEQLKTGDGARTLQWIGQVAASASLVRGARDGAVPSPLSQARIPLLNQLKKMQDFQFNRFIDSGSAKQDMLNYLLAVDDWAGRNGVKARVDILHPGATPAERQLCARLPADEDGALVFRTGEHTMAMSSRGGIYSFFEPNYGMASFRDRERFDDFVVAFLQAEGHAPPFMLTELRPDPSARPRPTALAELADIG